MKTYDKSEKIMIDRAKSLGLELCWDRLSAQQPQCGFGLLGICCRNCAMGPCRIDPFPEGPKKGVCGADADVICARNLARMVAAGAAAHSDHGRDIIETVYITALGKSLGYEIKDEKKLSSLAKEFSIDETKSKNEIAKEIAEDILEEFGTKKGYIKFIDRAPEKRKKLWEKLGVLPRGIDREIVEIMHRTHIGVDNDPLNIISQCIRASLSDGWGGSMIATEFSDVLFGTPKPIKGFSNLGVLKEDMVNIICHGHEPTLSEMIVLAARDKELLKLAKDMGASGINVCGMCCTGNELLMRQGVPVCGNFLQQELAIATGAVEAMVVDVQCIMPSICEVASCFHTKIISTSPKAKFKGAMHIEFHEEKALDIAKEIVKEAVLNFRNRMTDRVFIPDNKMEYMAGFSVESILEALGGTLSPIISAIKSGDIRGVCGIVGCNNPKKVHDESHVKVAKGLIEKDVLVVETGCAAIASAKAGLLLPEAKDLCGKGLKKVCEALSIPPVLHMGSCVDCSRILVLASEVAKALSVDISDLPICGAAPEWMSEKAVSIGTYFVASGVFTVLGVAPPILGAKEVVDILTDKAKDLLGASFYVEEDPEKMVEVMIAHIEEKRKALGI